MPPTPQMLAIAHDPRSATGNMRLSPFPIPTLLPDEILIKIAYAGVNRPDLLQRQGLYPAPSGHSPILGLEVSGWVEKIGSAVTGWQPGQKICALTNGGGYAEYCTVPAGQCLPVLPSLSLPEAAAIPETFFTSWHNLVERGHLKAGNEVLIHGGSGGVGSAAIQLGRYLGARVFTTASTTKKCQFAEQLGAVKALNYLEEDFLSLKNHTVEQQGFDIILDMVGGKYFEKNLQLLKHEGKLVQIATQQGSSVSLDLRQVMLKRLTITGSTLRSQSSEAKARIAQGFFDVAKVALAYRQILPFIYQIFSLADAQQAHNLMAKGEMMGKIILAVSK